MDEELKSPRPTLLVIVLLIVAFFTNFLYKKADCYIEGDCVERTRYEIIFDYFNGIKYDEINWKAIVL